MPTIDIPDKICRKCSSTTWFFRFDKLKNRTVYSCIPCKYRIDKIWRDNNPEVSKGINKKSRDKVKHTKEYKLKNVKRASTWNKNNPERHKEHHQKTLKNYVKNISDYYIKNIIVNTTDGIRYSDVTPQLIEIKRKSIKLKRQIKSLCLQ